MVPTGRSFLIPFPRLWNWIEIWFDFSLMPIVPLECWLAWGGEARRSALLLALLDFVPEQPVLTLEGVRQRLGISGEGARKLVWQLCQKGILKEATGKARKKVFIAYELIRVIGGS